MSIYLITFVYRLCTIYSIVAPCPHHSHFLKKDPSSPKPIALFLLHPPAVKSRQTIIKNTICTSPLAAGRISKRQQAYITKHSTTTKLLETTYDWHIAFNRRLTVNINYVDFARALALGHSRSVNLVGSRISFYPLSVCYHRALLHILHSCYKWRFTGVNNRTSSFLPFI